MGYDWIKRVIDRAQNPTDRVVVVGLDCASPQLFFERWRADLPHLSALMDEGVHGPLRSVHPPITIPAWMIMASGQDAGAQGVYGFRNLDPSRDPGEFWLTTRDRFQGKPLWERLGKHGLRSSVVGVPGTWPPRPHRGKMIPGILTPDDAPATWPPSLWSQVKTWAPGYAFDVRDFRNLSEEDLLQEVTAMTEARFDVLEELIRADDWNLLWSVEIGLDRLYHALWHYIDPKHPRHIADSPRVQDLKAYHQLLDRRIGRMRALLEDEPVTFVVVSDHGAKSMTRGFCINRWLVEEGLMVLKDDAPATTGRFNPQHVDWTRTRAWGMAGYCGRIFVHRQDRDKGGIVPPHDVSGVLEQIREGLSTLSKPEGEPLQVQTVLPSEIYEETRGTPPDMMVYLDDLAVRCLDSLGKGPLFVDSNDTGPDAANHDWDGVFIAAGQRIKTHKEPVPGARLVDISRLVETSFGL